MITDEEIREAAKRFRREKGMVTCDIQEFVKAVNFLIRAAYGIEEMKGAFLQDMTVTMSIFLERVGLQNDCAIMMYPGEYKPMFEILADDEE